MIFGWKLQGVSSVVSKICRFIAVIIMIIMISSSDMFVIMKLF